MQDSIIIVGIGETGFSCVEYFIKKQKQITVVDTRQCPPRLAEFKKLYPRIPIYTGVLPKAAFAHASMVVLSPGIAKDDPQLRQVLSADAEVVGDIELFAREAVASIVAITGSNGKSTVTTLLGEMAKAAKINVKVGGNLGTPALSLLSPDAQLYILELSSFQLETTYSLKSDVATILNVVPDHMDRYDSVAAYQAAKERIFIGAKNLVVNRDDEGLLPSIPTDLPRIYFNLGTPAPGHYGIVDNTLMRGSEKLLDCAELKILGLHNRANALAALALGESIGLPLAAMLKTLRGFPGLAHRCEWISSQGNIQWINDSKATNVGAAVCALQGLKTAIEGKWVLLAGGVAKNADFSPLKSIVKDTCRAVVLFGEASEELNSLLYNELPCFKVVTVQEAIQKAVQCARPGDGVLLSPACASFDQFPDFRARGEAFRSAVQQLPASLPKLAD